MVQVLYDAKDIEAATCLLQDTGKGLMGVCIVCVDACVYTVCWWIYDIISHMPYMLLYPLDRIVSHVSYDDSMATSLQVYHPVIQQSTIYWVVCCVS